MKLHRIKMTNFRQFYGDVTIDFSHDAKKNVTVIHGANAAGKTALLNALRWCLYGKVSLPDADRIASNRLVAETEDGQDLTVTVVLEFDHEGECYRLERSRQFRKHSALAVTPTGPQDVALSRIGNDGQSKTENNPQDRVRQILPEDIHPYFFFDGEDITALSEAEERIQDGIRNLMSITQFDRGIRHLRTAAGRFRREFSEHSTDEARQLDRDIEQYDTLLEELNLAEQEKGQCIAALQKEKVLLKERLKKLEPARDLQSEREGLEREDNELGRQIAGNLTEQRSLLKTHGALAFLGPAAKAAREVIEGLRTKGNLPAGIKDNFVRDLLARERCICGRPLAEGTEAHAAVERFLAEEAGSTVVENKLQTLAGQLETVPGSVDDLNQGLAGNLRRRQSFLQRRREISERLSEIASELKGKDDAGEVVELEAKREDIERALGEAKREIGGITARRETALNAQEHLKKKLAQLSVQEQKAELAKRRYQHCEEAQRALEEISDILVQEIRKNVADRINGVLGRVTGTDFKVELTQDFRLKTLQNVGGHLREIAKSTGQSQVTSLSFIGSLLDILREHSVRKGASGMLRGGEYPIVMDSPFGSLDDVYGPRIAALAPTLAPQVVVMVSGKQWLGGISEALYPFIGKQFVLVKNKPDPSEEDLRDGKVILGASTVASVVKSDRYEFTTIEEVTE